MFVSRDSEAVAVEVAVALAVAVAEVVAGDTEHDLGEQLVEEGTSTVSRGAYIALRAS